MHPPRRRSAATVLGLAWLAAAIGAALWVGLPRREHELGRYTTPLSGRTPGQRHNVQLAAQAIDGTLIPPGGEFSFNRTVGSWTRDRGYRLAPVSYGGEMVLDYGGGVCQVSSTLYNAALLAGMTVTQRENHVWEPLYIPAGRDAAVAQGLADLVFTNPWPCAARIHAGLDGFHLRVSIGSGYRPRDAFQVEVDTLQRVGGAPVIVFDRDVPLKPGLRARSGHPGKTVRCTRLRYHDGRLVKRETLSQDTYQALNAVVPVH